MPNPLSQIWSLAKKTVIDTRNDLRKLIVGQRSTEGSLKSSSSFESDEFAPRGKEAAKTGSTVPENSGQNESKSSKRKQEGSGKKSPPPNPPPSNPPNPPNPRHPPAANTPRRS